MRTLEHVPIRIGALLLCLMVATGCERRHDVQPFVTEEEDSEFVVAVLVDLSGSFLERMTEGREAHQFLMGLLDRFFRQRVGTNDQLILAQISGTPDRALLWQGSPVELRRDFPTAQAFAEFLRSKADANGSCVHSAIVQTIEYLTSMPGVAQGKSKSALFVLSDLVDEGSSGNVSRRDVVAALQDLARLQGAFFFYFVDQRQIPPWRRELLKAGLTCEVASEIRRPVLPNFD